MKKLHTRSEALMQSLGGTAVAALLGPSKPSSTPLPPPGRHNILSKTHLYETDKALRGNNRPGTDKGTGYGMRKAREGRSCTCLRRAGSAPTRVPVFGNASIGKQLIVVCQRLRSARKCQQQTARRRDKTRVHVSTSGSSTRERAEDRRGDGKT